MTLPCAVVRDLLPLYMEELTGEETGALVREHLEGCESCRAALEALREPAAEPVDSAAPLKTLKKDLRRRRWRTAAVCGTLSTLSSVKGMMILADKPERSTPSGLGNSASHDAVPVVWLTRAPMPSL